MGRVSGMEIFSPPKIWRAANGRTTTDSEVFDAINIEIEAHEKMFNMVCWFNHGWSMIFVICGHSNNLEVGILDLELVKPCHEELTKVSVYCFLQNIVSLTIVPLLKCLYSILDGVGHFVILNSEFVTENSWNHVMSNSLLFRLLFHLFLFHCLNFLN